MGHLCAHPSLVRRNLFTDTCERCVSTLQDGGRSTTTSSKETRFTNVCRPWKGDWLCWRERNKHNRYRKCKFCTLLTKVLRTLDNFFLWTNGLERHFEFLSQAISLVEGRYSEEKAAKLQRWDTEACFPSSNAWFSKRHVVNVLPSLLLTEERSSINFRKCYFSGVVRFCSFEHSLVRRHKKSIHKEADSNIYQCINGN